MNRFILKSLSILLIFTIFLSALSFFIYADEQGENAKELRVEDILSFSCIYNTETKSVNIRGTMNHDAFALHGNSTLLIYLIPAGKNESDVINDKNSKPIAQASVSISFAFSFKISSIEERYSRYAIFILSSDGEYILTTEAQYAETDANVTLVESRESFKGLSGNYSSSISSVNAQSTIIPVYLDSIFADDASGYMYQADDYQISFNKSYIDELDAQIRSLSLFNTKVYLRFLLRPNEIISTNVADGAEYALPNTFDKQTIIHIHAVTDFLVSRYLNGDNGYISGIVLGKSWDNAPKYNSFNGISLEEYILMCGNYVAIVSNAARDINPQINIALSFDADGFFVEENTLSATTDSRFSLKTLLKSLMNYFDASSYSGIRCSFLFETSETPLDITDDDIKNGIDINKALSDNKFYIGQSDIITRFLNELSKAYKSATNNYNILWIPNKKLHGNALCAAYSYAFYKLLGDNNVLSFNVEFSSEAGNLSNLNDLLFVIKSIDSNNSTEATEATKNLLRFFGKETWGEIIGVDKLPKASQKLSYSADTLLNLPKKIKGEFYYFDFSKAFLADGWINGVGCEDIKIDYLLTGKKALKANLNVGNNDFSDLIYRYEYSENISYTPYIKFNLEIQSEQLAPLYEIKFIFNSKDATFESNSIIKGNTQAQIILDMTKAKEFSLLESVKISLRSLDDSVDSATLCIRDITGYSKKYSNKELNEFVEKERDKQKYHNSDDGYGFWFKFGVVAAIISVSAIFGFILILFIKKNSRSRRKD